MNFLLRTKQILSAIASMFQDPDKATYYPDDRRKSKYTIWTENIKWLLKYKEVNHFYYFWGCDRNNTQPVDRYFSKKKFCRRRDLINASTMIGGKPFNYNSLLQDKFVFNQLLNGLGFAAPTCLALCSRTHIQWLRPYRCGSLKEFVKRENIECFIKDVLGERAEGVYKLKVSEGTVYLNDEPTTYERFLNKIGEKNLLQESITQHELLQQINPRSVNTIRIITARKQNEIVPLSAMLRVGTQKGVCDNLASGGLAVGIDLKSGTLGQWAFFKPGFGKRTRAHPDTGFVFEGVALPFFETALQMVRQLHRFFYGIHSIGWDIVISPNGPVILEGNNSWEIPTLYVFDEKLIDKYNETLQYE